jgi:hypothetical protein
MNVEDKWEAIFQQSIALSRVHPKQSVVAVMDLVFRYKLKKCMILWILF